jgi:polyferredoxin
MKKGYLKLFTAILLFLLAIYLIQTPVYTSIKGFVVDMGGSIEVAVGIAMGLIFLTFISGTVIIRMLGKGKTT